MTRKLILTIITLQIAFIKANAQQISPEKSGFVSFTISGKRIGKVNYYVSKNKIDETKPVLVYLDGSGPYPLFQYTERGVVSTVPINYSNLANNYHIVLISKPGVLFMDSVKMDKATGNPIYTAPKEYKENLSLDWRVNAVRLVLNNIMKTLKVNKKKIAVLGIAEGFQVGAKLASVEERVTHLLLFVGNGLNQFYDFIIQNRLDAQCGKITETESQKNIDSLLIVAKDIYSNPASTDREWYGDTYLRWSSFTNNNPTENILSLKIPVYIVAASQDRNTNVLGTDYLYLESVRQIKPNIKYKVYPYDHFLNEQIKNDKGELISVKNHMKAAIEDGLLWLKEN